MTAYLKSAAFYAAFAIAPPTALALVVSVMWR